MRKEKLILQIGVEAEDEEQEVEVMLWGEEKRLGPQLLVFLELRQKRWVCHKACDNRVVTDRKCS